MSYASAIAALPGAVAHWTFDETTGTFADSIGSHPLTVAGTVTRGVTPLLADGGKAATFPGTAGNTASAAASADWQFGTGDFWVALWFKTTDTGTKVALGGTTGGWYLIPNGPQFSLGNSASTVVQGGGGLGDGARHLAVATRVSGTVNLYLDGATTPVGTASYPGAMNVTGALSFGDVAGGGYPWAGTLDGPAVGKGSGLTATQAKSIYDAGIASAPAGPTPGTLSATGSTSSTVSLALAAATAGTSPYSYQFQRAPDASGSAGTFANDGSALTGQAGSATFTSTGLTASTTYWYRVLVTDAASGTATSNQVSQATAAAPAGLTAPTLAQSAATATAVPYTFAGVAGGTAPYSTRLYRSASAGFTPPGAGTAVGSAVAGTSGTLTDSSPLAGVAWYRAVTTDSAGTPASVLSAELPGAKAQPPLAIGFVGDSITFGYGLNAGQDPPTLLGADLAARFGVRSVTIVNRGVSGTKTGDWLSGGSNLPAARTAMVAVGVTHAHVMLGTNDAQGGQLIPAATYKANLQNVIAYLAAVGIKAILSAPTYPDITQSYAGASWNAASQNLLLAYRAQLDSLVDGVNVFAGDRLAWTYFAANRTLLADGIHPTAAGAVSLAELWGPPVAAALGLVATSTTTVRRLPAISRSR